MLLNFCLNRCLPLCHEVHVNVVLAESPRVWWLCLLLLRRPWANHGLIYLFTCFPAYTYLSLNSLLYMLFLMQSENQAISESYFALGSIFSGNFYAPALRWTTSCCPAASLLPNPGIPLLLPVVGSPLPAFQVSHVLSFIVLVLGKHSPVISEERAGGSLSIISISNLPTWLIVQQPGTEF